MPRVLPATHSLHFRVHTRVLLTLIVALAVTAALWAETPTRALLREAGAAQKSGHLATALQKLESARALRPDYPRLHLQLARLHASMGDKSSAFAALTTLADYGLALDFTADAALMPLTSEPGWPPLLARFAANAAPRGEIDTSCVLPAQDGIIETAVRNSAGRWFFADVRHRRILTSEGGNGRIREFSRPQDKLLGVFSLALDEARGRLWAGISATPETRGTTAAELNGAFLAEYDLASGQLLRSLPLDDPARAHVLGSLALAPDGSVFASDSVAPVIWRLAPGAARPEIWLESAEFVSLQGLALSADGRALYVADYANGLWRIDAASKELRLLRAPPGTTLFGIDDLRLAGDSLVAVQNGTAPQRLLRLALGADGEIASVKVLASGHAVLSDLAGGFLRDRRYHFVVNSGWELFSAPDASPAPRDVAIISVPLSPP